MEEGKENSLVLIRNLSYFWRNNLNFEKTLRQKNLIKTRADTAQTMNVRITDDATIHTSFR